MQGSGSSVPAVGSLAVAALAGAVVIYIVTYRGTRLRVFAQSPRKHWRVLLFDLTAFLACAVLVTVYLIEPTNSRGAFIAGASWQGLLGGALAGTELKKLRDYDPGAIEPAKPKKQRRTP